MPPQHWPVIFEPLGMQLGHEVWQRPLQRSRPAQHSPSLDEPLGMHAAWHVLLQTPSQSIKPVQQVPEPTGLPSALQVATHCPLLLQLYPVAHVPQLPLQLSEPQTLPLQFGVQFWTHCPLLQLNPELHVQVQPHLFGPQVLPVQVYVR